MNNNVDRNRFHSKSSRVFRKIANTQEEEQKQRRLS